MPHVIGEVVAHDNRWPVVCKPALASAKIATAATPVSGRNQCWSRSFREIGRVGAPSGLDPDRGDNASFADFTDPDGNQWVLQERGFQK